MAQQRAERLLASTERATRQGPAVAVTPFLTKADVARQHIQEMVVSGTVRAGDRLTTREVSEALGMSETPIREAMRSLAAEGWLDFNPHLGVVVASIKREQLEEVYAVRGALEGLALELGGPILSAECLDALDRCLEEAEEAVAALDIPRYVRLNREFHLLLSDTPATQWTLKVLNNLWAQTAALHRGFEAVPTARIRSSLDEHWAIRHALRAGDFAKAAALTVEHERIAGAALIASLSEPRGDGARDTSS
jgi:DNA-binding GntR family transcriptional regulator